MSHSVSNTGQDMRRDWDRPIRDAHYRNILSQQHSQLRMAYNGEINAREIPKTNKAIANMKQGNRYMGGNNDINQKLPDNRLSTNGSGANMRPSTLNPRIITPHAKRQTDRINRDSKEMNKPNPAYLMFLEQAKNMGRKNETVQTTADPNNNWLTKSDIKT